MTPEAKAAADARENGAANISSMAERQQASAACVTTGAGLRRQ